MAECKAVVRGDRIELRIKKEDPGYNEFAEVLEGVSKDGLVSYYGNVGDEDGDPSFGLILTTQP